MVSCSVSSACSTFRSAAQCCSADGAGKTPALPVGDPTFLPTQTGACDVDAKDLASVCHQKLPRPLGEAGAPCCYGVVCFKGSLERANLCIREANEQSGASRMLNRRSSSPCHNFVISATPRVVWRERGAVSRAKLVGVRPPIRFQNDEQTSH